MLDAGFGCLDGWLIWLAELFQEKKLDLRGFLPAGTSFEVEDVDRCQCSGPRSGQLLAAVVATRICRDDTKG